MPEEPTPMLTVLGELVVDLLPAPDTDPTSTAPHYVARPGGNALNVAVAAARLDVPVRLVARLGTGPMAPHLRRHAALAGVDVSAVVDAPEPVSLAVIGLAPDGSARYGFHVLGAADWQWTQAELRSALPDPVGIVHVGSITGWTPPGCTAIGDLVARLSGGPLISVDPNVRPTLAEGAIGAVLGNSAALVRERISALVSRADVVKVSAEDLEWLEPGSTSSPATLDAAAMDWATRGPGLVVLTDGGAPVRVARRGRPVVQRPIPEVAVVDTVGAGDSLAAGLLGGLLAAGVTDRVALDRLPEDALLSLVDEAALVAALACTRVGADAPTRAELVAARQGLPR